RRGEMRAWTGLLRSRSRRGFSPTPPNARQKFLLVLFHLPNERLIAGIFVRGCPEDHFGHDGCEIDSLGREKVDQLASVRGILLDGNDAVGFEFAKAVGQNVGGNS